MKERIQQDIIETRQRFLQEADNLGKSRLTYNPQLDREVYITLSKYKSLVSVEYEEEKTKLNFYTESQMKTHVGERFNVALSSFYLDIRDGQICPETTDEPFMNMLIRGRDYRKENGSSDIEREAAEVVGFEKTQEVLCDPSAHVGTMMLSISPPGKEGSIYQHNFYDMFILREDETGKRYIEARRYSSGLNYEEYLDAFRLLTGSGVQPSGSLDAYFLSHPIRLNNADPDGIHTFLHREHGYMNTGEFEEIIRICTPLLVSYINTLCDNPFDEALQLLTYNAILNKADAAAAAAAETIQHTETGQPYMIFSADDEENIRREIDIQGRKKVREVSTGCGVSTGVNVDSPSTPYDRMMQSSPYSVVEFGQEWFNCPKCGYQADGPVGNTCPNTNCGLTKEEYAKQGGTVC